MHKQSRAAEFVGFDGVTAKNKLLGSDSIERVELRAVHEEA
jgi:hypothetical protein